MKSALRISRKAAPIIGANDGMACAHGPRKLGSFCKSRSAAKNHRALIFHFVTT